MPTMPSTAAYQAKRTAPKPQPITRPGPLSRATATGEMVDGAPT